MLRKYIILFLLSTSLFAMPVDGLVAYFNFEGNTMDSSIKENHGTQIGGVSYTQGRVGQAAYFDGIDDRIIIGSTGYNLAQGAIGAWVQSDASLSNGTVFSQYSNDLNRLKLFAGEEARGFSGYSTTLFNLNHTLGASKSQFHYLLLNYNFTTKQHSLFVDGIQVATVTNSNAPQPGDAGQLTIGADKDFDNAGPYYLQSFFKGAIDELRIYDRNLTDQEILQLAAVPESNTLFLVFFVLVKIVLNIFQKKI